MYPHKIIIKLTVTPQGNFIKLFELFFFISLFSMDKKFEEFGKYNMQFRECF